MPEATTSAAGVGPDIECSDSLQLLRLNNNDDRQLPAATSNCNMQCTAESSPSFQIRRFVSTVRERDFSKCWPFRQQILDQFQSVGVRPFLPPFHQAESEDTVVLLPAEIVESLSEENCREQAPDELDNCTEQDFKLINSEAATDNPTAASELHATDDLGGSDTEQLPYLANETSNSVKQSDKVNYSEGLALPAADDQDGSKSLTGDDALPGSDELSDHLQVGLQVDGLLSHDGPDEHISDHQETACCHSDNVSMKDSNSQSPSQLESEAGSSYKVVAAESSDHEDADAERPCSRTEHYAEKHRVLIPEDGMAEKKQQESYYLKACMNLQDSETGFQDMSERLITELQTRTEKSRNSEDASFTCPNLDTQLIPKVCPVCLNFTSTSNTALNAHIDHCLESVLPNDQHEGRAFRNKYKPRKIRSMADICATAPARTLEDLERSAKLWALNDESASQNPSETPPGETPHCFLGWPVVVVRRQPRTSLNRGSAWRRKSIEQNLGVKGTAKEVQCSQEQKQTKVEKVSSKSPASKCSSQKEMHAKRSSIRVADLELKNEQSLKVRAHQLPSYVPEFSKSSHVVSQSYCQNLSTYKKRKKSTSLTLPSLKNIPSLEECFMSAEEQDECFWPRTLDFMVIDTSADEEKRLMQMNKSSKVQEADTIISELPDNVSVIGTDKKSGKNDIDPADSQLRIKETEKCQTRVISSDNEHLGDGPRKRKMTEIGGYYTDDDDADERPLGEDTIEGRHFERPMKKKRTIPKIKSLGTLVDTPGDKCKDRLRDPQDQKMSPVEESTEKLVGHDLTSTTNDEASYIGDEDSKLESSAYIKGCAQGRPDTDEQEESFSSKDHTSDMPYSCSLEHAQSPKDSSITVFPLLTRRALTSDHVGPSSGKDVKPHASEKHSDYRNVTVSVGFRDTWKEVDHEERNVLAAEVRRHDSSIPIAPKLQGFRVIANGARGHRNANDLSTTSSNMACGESGVVSVETSWTRRSSGKAETSVISCKMSSIASDAVHTSRFATVEDPDFTEGSAGFRSVGSQINSHIAHGDMKNSYIAYDHVSATEISNSIASSDESLPVESRILPRVPAVRSTGCNEQTVSAIECCDSQNFSMCNSSVSLGTPQDSSHGNDLYYSQYNPQYGNTVGKKGLLGGTQNGRQNNQAEGTLRGALDHSLNNTQNKIWNTGVCNLDSSSSKLQYSAGNISENGKKFRYEANTTGCRPVPYLPAQSLSMRPDVYTDLAGTMVGDSTWNQGTGSKFLNLMPMQDMSIKQGSEHHADAFQVIRGRTSAIASEQANEIAGGIRVSSNHHKTPSNSPICRDTLAIGMGNRRETLSTSHLSSSLTSYGPVGYSGDQGVVHIFGNPVFKLMGQNVMVTNNNISSLGDQNELQGLHPPASIRRFSLLKEKHMPFSHMMQQESYKSRSCSLVVDSPENQHCAFPSKQVGSFEPYGYNDPPGTATTSGQITVERANVLDPFQGSYTRMQSSVKSIRKHPDEVCIPGSSQISGPWFHAVNQQNDRRFRASNLLPEERQLDNQSLRLQNPSSNYLADVNNKIGLPGVSQFYGPNEQSGTLADIVNCSERSTNWQVPNGATADFFRAGN